MLISILPISWPLIVVFLLAPGMLLLMSVMICLIVVNLKQRRRGSKKESDV